MSFAAKRQYQGQLTATLTTVLATVPTAKQWIVLDMEVCNTDSVTRAVTISMPGSGASKRIFSAVSLEPGETMQWIGRIVLEAGETICGGADAASVVTVLISGVEGP